MSYGATVGFDISSDYETLHVWVQNNIMEHLLGIHLLMFLRLLSLLLMVEDVCDDN